MLGTGGHGAACRAGLWPPKNGPHGRGPCRPHTTRARGRSPLSPMRSLHVHRCAASCMRPWWRSPKTGGGRRRRGGHASGRGGALLCATHDEGTRAQARPCSCPRLRCTCGAGDRLWRGPTRRKAGGLAAGRCHGGS
eukprot:6632597-Prymnesium_polylepis.1